MKKNNKSLKAIEKFKEKVIVLTKDEQKKIVGGATTTEYAILIGL
ncbi:hypothetical protein VRU48_09885 [Pedobacter sp. KR3-3]|uniref:Bacteriocin-type signal sequence-containing protein n=1 Tax=Pedobacter albus TaxID=3113905 RepID=A0ABU7I7G3_9SPHI|nr:hypothetical protein [Pedobacter sp. KR3-3]MEE1945418.1 hypothetical protein [Pedobacter sp. KR3-3]